MTGFKSPIGSKNFSSPPMKEVVIPDESGSATSVGRRFGSNQPEQPQFNEQDLQNFLDTQNARMNSAPTVTQEQLNLEQQFRDAREAKRLGRERLNEGSRRRIEMLIGMTQVTRNFNLDNNEYILRTLRDIEMREAIMSATVFDGTVQSPFEIRKQLLARSLVSIAGMDASQFFGSNEIEDKLQGLELFDHYLLGRLYDEYLLMVKEARNRYAIKNEADAKEVVEDLKK